MAIDTQRFRFLRDALHGTGGFRDGSYLIQYPRESEDKFAARKKVAWYPNPMAQACHRFVGYLSRYRPTRELANPLLNSFADDANWRGDALDVVFDHFMTETKARGCMLMLVDMPRAIPDLQDEQIESRSFPYLVPIPPEQITEYELDERGRLHAVTITDGRGKNARGESVLITRSWNTTGWSVAHNGEEVESGRHDLGVCPVLIFSESGNFPVEGAFSPIADMARRLFNMLAELDELLRAQTFSLLAYQVPPEAMHHFNAGQVAEAIGTHNMLVHSGNAPAFISPDSTPTDAYFKAIEMLRAQIDDIGLDVQPPDQSESGIAMQLRFQMLNAALSQFARRMEDFERRIWDLVARWLGIKDSTAISWPKDYSLADLGHEIEVYQNLQAIGAPPEYLDVKLKQIASLDLTGADPETLERIKQAIDVHSHERGAA